MIHPVILCGGNGTRLWPRSRTAKPKPFLQLVGRGTLFEQALYRCRDRQIFAAPIIVTGAAHLGHVRDQSAGIADVRIIVEPESRNTAPAIALAAMDLPDDATMLVCPSDHHIGDEIAFKAAAEMAANLAANEWLVSFGISPTRPETGYGYIKRGDDLGGGFAIDSFVEKPDAALAEEFVNDPAYSWNAGIFAFKAAAYLAELNDQRPEMIEAVRDSYRYGVGDGGGDGGGDENGNRGSDTILHPSAEHFAAIKAESVDYAVMENSKRTAMVPVAMQWSDIGSWKSLHEAREKDDAGNTVYGKSEIVDCTNILVESDGPRVSAIGLDNVVIIVDGNDVLVTTMDGAQKVGTLDASRNQTS